MAGAHRSLVDTQDSRFLKAIMVGAALGIPIVWVVMTVGFMFVTDQRFVDVAGFAALPAFFCGPFLGGLFTTSLAQPPDDERDDVLAPDHVELPRAA